jgi:hypothetical protein
MTTELPATIDGLRADTYICCCPTEEVAMEVAGWLYAEYLESLRDTGRIIRRPVRRGERPVPVGYNLLAIVDATGDENFKGFLVFWPDQVARWPAGRKHYAQRVAEKFAGRGVLFQTKRLSAFGPRVLA